MNARNNRKLSDSITSTSNEGRVKGRCVDSSVGGWVAFGKPRPRRTEKIDCGVWRANKQQGGREHRTTVQLPQRSCCDTRRELAPALSDRKRVTQESHSRARGLRLSRNLAGIPLELPLVVRHISGNGKISPEAESTAGNGAEKERTERAQIGNTE